MAKKHNILVLVDGAQAISHIKVDVTDLDCDFYAFSGHKMYGPMGIGILYAKQELLKKMPPFQGGGDMIETVDFDNTTFAPIPYKFEAGTPNVAGVIGLKSAISYLSNFNKKDILEYENSLLNYAIEKFNNIPGIKILGNPLKKAPVLSFVMDKVHPHDVSTILDNEGICIRAGHLCTQPLMKRFNQPAFLRASFSFYNTFDEIDHLVFGLKKVREIFAI